MKRHLIGIGGVGMSALATALKRLGDDVTGADRNLKTKNIAFLERLGIRCFPDDGSGVDAATDEVIVSTAIEPTNAGLKRAEELSIPVTHRAKALARALSDRKLVAVVGTCGKSTVTAMLGHVLTACGLDPFCVNGANVPGWEGAVRFGRGAYAVAEVDESDKSLVAFSPYAAIVTNASADHYSKEEMDRVFDDFIAHCEGPVIDGRGALPEALAQTAAACAESVSMPGAHNRANATLAAAMALSLGCAAEDVKKALASFQGVERRLQRILPTHGDAQNAPAVFDDYAHNPEKIKALWTTLAEAYPSGVCVIWRPHGYAPLRKMLNALAAMFAETIRPNDHLLLLPVYDAGGTTDRSINSDALAARLSAAHVTCVADLAAAHAWVCEHTRAFGVFATCGARDPDLPALAQDIADCVVRRTLLVGYHAADLTPALLADNATCFVLDIYHRHAIEKVHHAKVVCAPHIPNEPWDEIRFRTGPKLMSGELALDLLQEIHLHAEKQRRTWCRPCRVTLDYVGRERDRNELQDKIRDDPKRVRSFKAVWEASVPRGPKLTFVSYPGCFCHRRLDEGGLALAEVVTAQLQAGALPAEPLRLLDMGCGCGLVSCLIAKAVDAPFQLTLVDSHARAVEAACENVARFGLAAEVILADNGTPRRLDGTFDVFVGNPPYYSDYRIADVFLETAKRALKPGGVCYTVCKNAEGLEPVQRRYFDAVEVLPRRGYAVLRSVKGLNA